MIDSLFFSGFDPLHEVPEVCTLCSKHPPVFAFDRHAVAEGRPRRTTGFCCVSCGRQLLSKLEQAESQEWKEEEAALEEDAYDVSDFRRHRLAAFPDRR